MQNPEANEQNFSLTTYLQNSEIASATKAALEIVFSNLSPKDLANVSLVSKIFKEIADKLLEKYSMNQVNALYKNLPTSLKKSYPELAKNKTYREIYRVLNENAIFKSTIQAEQALGNPSKAMQENLGKFSFFPKEVFLEILSYLSKHNLATIARVSRFFLYMSENDFLWKPLAKDLPKISNLSFKEICARAENLKNFLEEKRHEFNQNHPGLFSILNGEKEKNNLYEELRKSANDKEYASSSLNFRFYLFHYFCKDLEIIIPKELQRKLEKNKREIIALINEKREVLLVLANEALLNSNSEVFKLLMDFVFEYCSDLRKDIILSPRFYAVLNRYLSFKQISASFEREIHRILFSFNSIGKSPLIEFIIAFHHDFLLRERHEKNGPFILTVFLQHNKSRIFERVLPLHFGLTRGLTRDLFIPLIKFFEKTFAKADVFFYYLFEDWYISVNEEILSKIFAQFSKQFIKDYRSAEQGDTLLIMALKCKSEVVARILIEKCPELVDIADAKQKMPSTFTSVLDLKFLIRDKSKELEAKNAKPNIKIEQVEDEKKSLIEESTDEISECSVKP